MKRRFFSILRPLRLAIAVLASAPFAFAAEPASQPANPGAGDQPHSLSVDGKNRSYLIHLPAKYDPTHPTPVVLAFHGGGGNAQEMVRFCGLDETADQDGFIVVYPNGTGRLQAMLTWNGGNCCGYALENNVDDVAFVRALLADLAKNANVDPKRVYATGISNGGILCYRLACELSDRIAAIAPISGTMGMTTCNPKRPVPILHFHGTEDQFVPFKGGSGTKSLTKTDFDSVQHTIQTWVEVDGCPQTPVLTDVPTKNQDGTWVQIRTYGPGRDGAEVVLVVIQGGGHTWPGHPTRLNILGKSTTQISANDMMWDFFRRHPMK